VLSWDGTSYQSDPEGLVRITVPDDRTVQVRVSYPGYLSQTLEILPWVSEYRAALRLGGVLETRELIILAENPGESETRVGRSVAISGEALAMSSQIGLIEDVMSSVRLLPGVGYTGMYNALPSIRGGHPGDLMAVLDGFYISNPYHWGGGFSIFDPRMTESARLSHGVFSSRYGHTISGLLEVQSKGVYQDHGELDLAVSTSALSLSAARPLGGRPSAGGLMVMGRVTYWDPFIWALKGLSQVWDNETLQLIHSVTRAPYIRSGALSFSYRLSSDLDLRLFAFAGADGVGADFQSEIPGPLNNYEDSLVQSRSRMIFDWDNLQAFALGGLSWSPRPSMFLRFTGGAGYEHQIIRGVFTYDYLKVDEYRNGVRQNRYTLDGEHLNSNLLGTQRVFTVQGALDYDMDLGRGFLLALGVSEHYNETGMEMEGKFFIEREIRGGPLSFILPPGEPLYIRFPVTGRMEEQRNQRYNSSAYILGEYRDPQNRWGAELGLRVDHLYFAGQDLRLNTAPAMNPRLNLDYALLQGGESSFLHSLDLTAGTGLFSSMNDAIASITVDNRLSDFELKPNRSWTSILGLKADFGQGWSFAIEGYYKYVFNRAYQYMLVEPGLETSTSVLRFDGEGRVWGFDLQLQRFRSRFFDGWISYTFTHARYKESERPRGLDEQGRTIIEESPWYYPWFHRFHNLNLVLNIRPRPNLTIYTRVGLASGRPKPVVGAVERYQVLILDEGGNPVADPSQPSGFLVIQNFRRDSRYDDGSRTTWSFPLDLKLSYLFHRSGSRVRRELYLAAENLSSLFYRAQANTSFNQYTGQEQTGSDAAAYELPVPMVSVGLRWSF
ncbi:MAG: TonB-dependent receptor plug domain-containing protein, partial [Treponema sp.]|nr:TonB-dependent receptor plug domain-containing protein [Treponema sp.]